MGKIKDTCLDEIRQRVPITNYLKKSKKGSKKGNTGYICPYCDSGNGNNGNYDGAMKIFDDGNHRCMICKEGGDIFHYWQHVHNVDFPTAAAELATVAGITLEYEEDGHRTLPPVPERAQNSPKTDFIKSKGNVTATVKNAIQAKIEPFTDAPKDYTAYYAECLSRIEEPAAVNYLNGRGITLETAGRYFIGFDPRSDPANAPAGESRPIYPTPRIIIPMSKDYYIGRRTDGNPKHKAMMPKGGTAALFNAAILNKQEVQEVFITEAAFDALSVIEAGAQAIALNGAGNADKLINYLEEHGTTATMILCLDNDDAGQEATEKIRKGLERLNIEFTIANIAEGYKDANEALTADKEKFVEAVNKARAVAADRPDNTIFYLDHFFKGDIGKREKVATCFDNFNEKAGGLHTGLHILAAIPSLGKTTFAVQMADELAAAGKDVLFFSLEQSRLAIVAKSLAREMKKAGGRTLTSTDIMNGQTTPEMYSAINTYKSRVQNRMNVIQGNFNCDIEYIAKYIRRYIERTKAKPIVFIDYLQILQPKDANRRNTTKENIDQNLTELKRLSDEMNLIIFAISSVNRTNYMTPIDFEALKETGGIEYTADAVYGLQLQAINNNDIFDTPANTKIKEKRNKIKAAKAEHPRRVELCCLKSRFGIATFSCYFKYYCANDYFVVDDTAERNAEEEKIKYKKSAKML